jgi:hypothetical protein
VKRAQRAPPEWQRERERLWSEAGQSCGAGLGKGACGKFDSRRPRAASGRQRGRIQHRNSDRLAVDRKPRAGHQAHLAVGQGDRAPDRLVAGGREFPNILAGDGPQRYEAGAGGLERARPLRAGFLDGGAWHRMADAVDHPRVSQRKIAVRDDDGGHLPLGAAAAPVIGRHPQRFHSGCRVDVLSLRGVGGGAVAEVPGKDERITVRVAGGGGKGQWLADATGVRPARIERGRAVDAPGQRDFICHVERARPAEDERE